MVRTLMFLGFAAGAEGLRSRDGAVVQEGAELGLRLPSSIDFAERSKPIVDVFVEQGVSKPEEAKDALVALSVDAKHGLHLHRSGQASAAWTPLAWADYKNTVSKNGWGYLSVKATDDPKVSNDLKMYAAGYLEGYVSAKQIRDFQHNANALIKRDEKNHDAMSSIRGLFDKEINTIESSSGMGSNGTVLTSVNAPKDAWWRHARYMMMQGWGILDAYNLHAEKLKGVPMSLVDLMVLNSDGETPELEMAYDYQEVALRQATKECGDCNDDNATSLVQEHTKHARKRGSLRGSLAPDAPRDKIAAAQARREKFMKHIDDAAWRRIKMATGRCSALVRLAGNNSDIFVGHTTFSDYSEMNRIWKVYDLPLGVEASRKMSFSSYPGVVGSTDDYYIMDTGLLVTETTVSMLTDEPFDKLNDSAAVMPDYMRIMLSNRLAKTGEEWVNYMNKSATGTYNSQWMVVDYNKFQAGQKLQNGTLWILEQAPGISIAVDESERLQKLGFWSSENRAFFSAIRNVSGETEAEDENGALFSADHNPRANIFAATAPAVNALAEMRSEMQRNNWPHEVDGGPYNTPDHAISARGDLAGKDSAAPNGGVDSKVSNACLMRKLTADAIAGPTHQNLKPFRWTDDKGKVLFPDYPRDGLPDLWNFDWVRMTPTGEAAATGDC